MERFGPYLLLKSLAVGGLGEVYLAKKSGPGGFEKLFALKRARPERVRTAEDVQVLIDEAKFSARLTHGHIAQTLDLIQVGDEWAVVQEYIDGLDVARLSRCIGRHRRRLGLDECVHVAKEILVALDYVHRLTDAEGHRIGVRHGDVAPANVMVSAGGEVKLVDFGSARAASLTEIDGGFGGGKLRYLAPEQVSGIVPDQRADLYAVGIVLWELCAGQRVYEGFGPEAIVGAVAKGAVPPLAAARPDAPEPLVQVLHRALQPNPRLRYPHAAAFLRALEDQNIANDPARSRHVLGDIVRAAQEELAAPRPRLVSVAEDRSLEDSLVDALDP